MQYRTALALILVLSIFFTGLFPATVVQGQVPSSENEHFVVYVDQSGEIVCREATELEKEQLDRVRPRNLRQLNHLEENALNAFEAEPSQFGHLTINLVGTDQLNGHAQAKAAFIRAAEAWESRITTPITLYVQADFGPNFFDSENPYPSGVLGQTSSVTNSLNYAQVRDRLLARADSAAKQTVYNALPSTSVPTDLGPASSVSVSRTVQRALGFLPTTADPNDSPPRIGFNSAFNFDFDRSDGITSGFFDFEAVVIHEIGHALGFTSRSGQGSATPAMWDLYRFRSGTTAESFTSAERIMTVGGPTTNSQYYFTPGISELGLSDGGPSGVNTNNADGSQSSHWRGASRNGGIFIGIMDPRIPSGTRRDITDNDIRALGLFGYSANLVAPPNDGSWVQTSLNPGQVQLKSWTTNGQTSVYVKLLFPDAGFRVANWGSAFQTQSNGFAANATIERWTGISAQMLTSTAQIYNLGSLPIGDYFFTFQTSGQSVSTINFSVTGALPPPNPIDDAQQFVTWQYRDFLRREPDGPGLAHWTNEITMCSNSANRFPGESDANCRARKRASTSAAFFMSPEFQTTSYFVLRVYRGSLGRMPRFGGDTTTRSEFTADAATVASGIVMNNQLDPARINSNKEAFVNAFVNRSEFRAIYDNLSNTQYVDKLFQTTGVTPTSDERNALIAEAGTAGGRASVLYKIVDGTTTINSAGHLAFNTRYGKLFYDNMFNAAFVQMEYFGYLLRDPDDGGFNFWLGKLNTFGNWVDAQMVLAFINSPEYRSRFGSP